MSHMRGEVIHCIECDAYFCKSCEEDVFECDNCGEVYCFDCADEFRENVPSDWCRDCFENCCAECGLMERTCQCLEEDDETKEETG